MAIQTIDATIQIRGGMEENFDPDQMTAREWAVSTDTKKVWMCFRPGLVLRMATYDAFEQDMGEIREILLSCQTIQEAVEAIEEIIIKDKKEVEIFSILSKSYAVGGTGTRPGEDSDNAKYYSEQAKAIAGDVRVTGVKGAKEENYRDGNVNLTAENIGAATKEELEGYLPIDGNAVSSTKAKQDWSGNVIPDTYAKRTFYNDNSINIGRKEKTTIGNNSIAVGTDVEASGENSAALGEGVKSKGRDSFSNGSNTTVFNAYAQSFGGGSVSSGMTSHSEGIQTISGNGYILHVKSVDASLKKIIFTETYDNFSESFAKISIGTKIHLINIYYVNTASLFTVSSIYDENSVIVEEDIPENFTPWLAVLSVINTDEYVSAHSEGKRTISNGANSHAEGRETESRGENSHAENLYSISSGANSHAGGSRSESKGLVSFTHGLGTISGSAGQAAFGWYNIDENNPSNYRNPLVVGNGSSASARSNAFRVSNTGAVYGKSEYNSSGADYAEFIKEWYDGNPDSEDRVGYFVTVKDGYLYKANKGDYIVGITSGNPSVVGNSDEEYYWRWKRDEFNRVIYEEVPELAEKLDKNEMPVMDDDGNPIMIETGRTISVMKQREDYDNTLQQSYIERKNRKEWDYVGMVGVVPVRDDGTCEPGQFCRCEDGGIATVALNRDFDTYMVIERVSKNIVSVILK